MASLSAGEIMFTLVLIATQGNLLRKIEHLSNILKKKIGNTDNKIRNGVNNLFSSKEESKDKEENNETTENEKQNNQNNITNEKGLSNKGIGPISKVVFEKEVNIQMSNSGEKLFNQLCTSCHMINEDYIGPAMSGILERRSPEWIMNMILNPIQMLEEDSIAIELLERYNFEYMYNQNLLEEEAREILEYFRIID